MFANDTEWEVEGKLRTMLEGVNTGKAIGVEILHA